MVVSPEYVRRVFPRADGHSDEFRDRGNSIIEDGMVSGNDDGGVRVGAKGPPVAFAVDLNAADFPLPVGGSQFAVSHRLVSVRDEVVDHVPVIPHVDVEIWGRVRVPDRNARSLHRDDGALPCVCCGAVGRFDDALV